MMGSKMKDWDKEDNEQNDSDENADQQSGIESSEDSEWLGNNKERCILLFHDNALTKGWVEIVA